MNRLKKQRTGILICQPKLRNFMIPLLKYPLLCASNHRPEKESANPFSLFTEKHLQALWLEQKYFHPLHTVDNRPIKIISPGIWNNEAGPDFKNAHLFIGNQELRGDIELHLREEGWNLHKHQIDERYNQVILHVALWPSSSTPNLKTQNHHPLYRLCLLQLFNQPPATLLRLIDLDLYPHTRFVGTGRCSEELFNHISEKETRTLFKSAAYWRLEKKYEFLSSQFPNPSDQIKAGIAIALGYKHNSNQFLDVFRFLNPLKDMPHSCLLSIALGICGFFEKEKKQAWSKSNFYNELSMMWGEYQFEMTHQANLRLDHIRPLNHPIRRLAFLVYLLQDSTKCMWENIFNLWSHYISLELDQKTSRQFLQQLLDSIPSYLDPYWNTHYTFEEKKSSSSIFLSMIGENLKKKIVLNTILPMLYHEIRRDPTSENSAKFDLLFSKMRSEKSSKTRYLHHRFFGSKKTEEMLKNSYMEQGGFQIHKDFCIHFEASCEGCPFVSRYSDMHNRPCT